MISASSPSAARRQRDLDARGARLVPEERVELAEDPPARPLTSSAPCRAALAQRIDQLARRRGMSAPLSSASSRGVVVVGSVLRIERGVGEAS